VHRHAIALAAACVACSWAGTARAQNDWQFPDPYFGILEIEKSHNAAAWRRYRAEVDPAPRRTISGEEKPAGAATAAEQPAPARAARFRWRTRSRR